MDNCPDKTTNVDYIGVVREVSNIFEYVELTIIRSHQDILQTTESMIKNESLTACDMSDYFSSCFPVKKDFNYCYPYSYNSIHYGDPGGFFPEFMNRNKYQNLLSELEKEHRIELDRLGWESKRNIRQERIRKDKKAFWDKCQCYVFALDYYSLFKQLEKDRSIKMFSTEVVGEYSPKSTMEFKITKDISFSLHTNFRYGNSSCFFLNMSYKGIQLLFYSDYVTYYLANAVDIIRHTKSFEPKRENWPDALRMVAAYSTKAHQAPERFEVEFIGGQISEMLSGLRNIMKGQSSLKSHIDNMTRFAQTSKYIGLRTISDSDRASFLAFPQEMELVYKTEKITGALDLLESMKVFTSICSDVMEAISEIQQMNRSLAPKIVESIQMVESELADLNRRVKALTADEQTLASMIEPYLDERAAFLEKVDRDKCPEPLKKFDEDHPVFVQLSQRKDEVQARKLLLSLERDFRTSYRDRIQKCLDKVIASGLLVM